MIVKIPAYIMIAHLSKTPALIAFESLTELISYNISEYSYS